MEFLNYVWPGLAIWLSWLWVAIGEGILAKKSIEIIWKSPKLSKTYLTVTILWIALVESAAIYGLVLAFQMINADWLWVWASIAAWLAIWLAWLGAGWWEWQLVAGWISAMDRNPQLKNKILTFMVLFVALVEVTAIYGFIIANKIIQTGWENMAAVWAWLAIWLAWLWVGIWRWYLSEWALEIMWQNPKMISYLLTVSILWVALVESAAIYAWIISYKILWWAEIWALAAIWAWLAIWATWLWAWVWEWILIKWAIKWMNYSPENKNQILTFMILFVALVESAAIYWLIVAFKLLW